MDPSISMPSCFGNPRGDEIKTIIMNISKELILNIFSSTQKLLLKVSKDTKEKTKGDKILPPILVWILLLQLCPGSLGHPSS